MEDFFSTLEIELVHRTSWRTREEAENALFAYVDGRYDQQRIKARPGRLSPGEYEADRQARQAVPDDQPATPADGAESAPAK